MDIIGTLCELALGAIDQLGWILRPVETLLNWWIDFLGGLGA